MRGKHVVSVVEDAGDDLEEERLIPVLSCYPTLPDVRRDLGKTAHEREDRRADLPDPPSLPRPGKADIERSVSRQPSVLDLEQQCPACPLDMREEMNLPEGVDMDDDKPRREKPEDQPDEPGAEGGSGGSADVPPAAPSDDDSALGDTDQHSDAQA